MKNYLAIGLALSVALGMASCKSSESAYKKAYEKANPATVQTQTVQTVPAPVQTQPVNTVAPVQTVTTTPVTAVENPRTESVTIVSGQGLKAYSVVVGSFSVKANAEARQRELNNAGYAAQIAYNAEKNSYRVIATTFDDMNAAVQSRNNIRNQYPDAWLLRK